MNKVKSFKEFIVESIWSDMQDRGTGDAEKREDVGNKKSVEALARKVVDELKSSGFQSDFSDDIKVVSPDDSSFYAGAVDTFNIEMEKGIYAGRITVNKDKFTYDDYICVSYGLYVSDTPLRINDYDSVTAWIDIEYGDEDDYDAGIMDPAAFYYIPEMDEWISNDLRDPILVKQGKWVKRIMSIVAHVVNPDTKIK